MEKAGIDFNRFDSDIDGNEIRKKYGIEKDDVVLFFVGWLYHFSGLKEVAIELSRVKDEKPNIKLLIVGEWDALYDLSEDKRGIPTGNPGCSNRKAALWQYSGIYSIL